MLLLWFINNLLPVGVFTLTGFLFLQKFIESSTFSAFKG